MTREGKFSRAIRKSGSEQRLEAMPQTGTQSPPSAAARGRDADSPAFRRVKDHFGTPGAHVIMRHDERGEAASQIRSIRARILASTNGALPRVITVTSSARKEGKTTIAMNLAAALAEVAAGRVVIIDGDLPSPGLDELANVQHTTGLNEILDNNLQFDGNVYETMIPGLDIIPARAMGSENNYEGVLSQRCGELVARLRQFYSHVIIDTPPVLAGGQAITFGKHSDGVLLVARLEKTQREVVKRAQEELERSGAKVLGCILTHRKHHVPDLIYRFLGTTPRAYYGYGRGRNGSRAHHKPEKAE